MRQLIHQFLKWAPVGTVGTLIAAAGVWSKAKDALTLFWSWGGERMSDPFAAFALVTLGLSYVAALVWTGRSSEPRRKQSIAIGPNLLVESRPITIGGEDVEGFYCNQFYIPVGNQDESGATLERVTAYLHHFTGPTQLNIKGISDGEISIRNGEWFFFKIGEMICKEAVGFFQFERFSIPSDSHLYNARNDKSSFHLVDKDNKTVTGLNSMGTGRPFELSLVVTAKDVPYEFRHVNIISDDVRNPIIVLKPPSKIQSSFENFSRFAKSRIRSLEGITGKRKP